MIMSNCSSIFKCMRNHVNSHNTIFRTISVYKDIQYFIIYIHEYHILSLIAIFEYHEKCSSKYWKLKWMLYHYIRNIPLYVFRNILFWELLYMLLAQYLIFLWLRKKTTISDSNTLRWLIYILLIVPTVFFPGTSINWFFFNW